MVSACLVGLSTRYDAKSKQNNQCVNRLRSCHWIPVCPEQLGGLSTPRNPADLINGDGNDVLTGKAKVITADGQNVTDNFIHGAKQVVRIADSFQLAGVFLKARSPSCGINHKLGVTAALLQKQGYVLEEF